MKNFTLPDDKVRSGFPCYVSFRITTLSKDRYAQLKAEHKEVDANEGMSIKRYI